jgi:GNAT superfamily N-acetyltransferase
MSITVAPLAAEHMSELYRLSRDAWVADVPDIPFASEATFAAMTQQPPAGQEAERYVALLDGVVAGFLRLRFPMLDNRENAHVQLITSPAHRRRGVGRALAGHAVQRSAARGRRNLDGETIDHRPEGAAFATALGAKMALAETRSRLDVPPPDPERLDALLADARRHSTGYRLRQWTGVPSEEHLADIAYLDSRYYTDAPSGDLVVETQKVDPERLRAAEKQLVATGRTSFHTAAVHEATGSVVAWTFIVGNDDTPEQAWQQLTMVDPAHRGHRLGLLVKLENLRFIRAGRPELAGIDTFNATANEHMLAINDTMGFRRVDQWMQWLLTI